MKSIDLIPTTTDNNDTIYIIYNFIVLSDLVESSGYSSKTLQKGPCPYASLDEALRYSYFWGLFMKPKQFFRNVIGEGRNTCDISLWL